MQLRQWIEATQHNTKCKLNCIAMREHSRKYISGKGGRNSRAIHLSLECLIIDYWNWMNMIEVSKRDVGAPLVIDFFEKPFYLQFSCKAHCNYVLLPGRMAVWLPEEDLAYSKLKHFPRSINKHSEVLECGDSIFCILPFSLNRLFPLSCVCLW